MARAGFQMPSWMYNLIEADLENSGYPRIDAYDLDLEETENVYNAYVNDLWTAMDVLGLDELDLEDPEYLVLMTLRGEGVGIWDGSWDDELTRDQIKWLLREAYENAAYDAYGEPEPE